MGKAARPRHTKSASLTRSQSSGQSLQTRDRLKAPAGTATGSAKYVASLS